jgi:hypothetical protein
VAAVPVLPVSSEIVWMVSSSLVIFLPAFLVLAIIQRLRSSSGLRDEVAELGRRLDEVDAHKLPDR